MNLATCFAPTLFYFEHYPKTASSSQGMPDYREIHDQRKAMEILAFMIDHVRLLYLVPNELHRACHFSYIEIGEPCTLDELARRVCELIKAAPFEHQSNQDSQSRRTKRSSRHTKEMSTLSASDSIGSLSSSSCENVLLNENNNNNNNNHSRMMRTSVTPLLPKGACSYQTFIDRCIIEVIRESCYTKFKGWTSFGKNNEPTLACKRLDDGHPLGLWKSSVEIEAPPIEILNRLLNERHLWDDGAYCFLFSPNVIDPFLLIFRFSSRFGGGTAQSQHSCVSIHHQLHGRCSALPSAIVIHWRFRHLWHRDISVKSVVGDLISTWTAIRMVQMNLCQGRRLFIPALPQHRW